MNSIVQIGISQVDTGYIVISPLLKDSVEILFSCSATGKPAPTIEWDGSSKYTQSQTTIVSNSDNTFTSSQNITVRVPLAWDGHVDCLLNTGQRGQRRERIPYALSAGHKQQSKWPKIIILLDLICIHTCTWAKGSLLHESLQHSGSLTYPNLSKVFKLDLDYESVNRKKTAGGKFSNFTNANIVQHVVRGQ